MAKRLWTVAFTGLILTGLCARGADPVQETPGPTLQEENARLTRENEALRKENQRLRRLLVQQDAKGHQGTERTGAQSTGNESAVECDYWLSTKSLRRHNSGCRMFRKSKGRPCGKDEGKPCGICGG